MFEILPGLFLILVFLFLTCKILAKVGKACGVNELRDILDESFMVGSGRLPSHRDT